MSARFEASRVRAREALAYAGSIFPEEGNLIRRLAILGLFLAAAVWPLSRMPAFSGIPVPGYMATFSLFLGFVSFLPDYPESRRNPSACPSCLRAGLGETHTSGPGYLRSAGARVAISVGALITAIALFSALVIMVHSFRVTVSAWIQPKHKRRPLRPGEDVGNKQLPRLAST